MNPLPILELAIEKGVRFFENNTEHWYRFLVLQVKIELINLENKKYLFEIHNGNNIFSKNIQLNIKEKKVISLNSHEDPLTIIKENNVYYGLICLQLNIDEIELINNDSIIIFKTDDKIIIESGIKTIDFAKKLLLQPNISQKNNDWFINANQNCQIRIHSGKEKAKYKEQEFKGNKNSIIDIKKYLLNNVYLGIQFSYFLPEYENINIEEKYIIVGQKGINESGIHYYGDLNSYPLLPFDPKYQKKLIQNSSLIDINYNLNNLNFSKKVNWININNIESLLKYYLQNKPIVFESNFNFLITQYKNKHTYGYNVFTEKINNKLYHVDKNPCVNCSKKTQCIQIVPSGLSYELYKYNISLDEPNNCEFFKLLK